MLFFRCACSFHTFQRPRSELPIFAHIAQLVDDYVYVKDVEE